LFGSGAVLGHPNLMQRSLGFSLLTLRQFIEQVGRSMHPATLLAGAAEDLRQRLPFAQCLRLDLNM